MKSSAKSTKNLFPKLAFPMQYKKASFEKEKT